VTVFPFCDHCAFQPWPTRRFDGNSNVSVQSVSPTGPTTVSGTPAGPAADALASARIRDRGRPSTSLPEPADLLERVRDSGFREQSITAEHAITAGRLPLIHRNPFDRMLIAQSQCERLTLVTRDPEIHKYDVPLLMA
jgi:hypothetical protein